jgi:hypothetical protein
MLNFLRKNTKQIFHFTQDNQTAKLQVIRNLVIIKWFTTSIDIVKSLK